MEPSIRYILSRALLLIALLVALLYGYGFIKKQQRRSAVVAELRQICGESSFFRQFSAEDAHKTLIRAIGLLAEADSLGMAVDDAIDGGLGVKTEWFENELDEDDTPMKDKIIRASLRGNYDNFIKLGFKPGFSSFKPMQDGQLAAIPSGTFAGRKPVIKTLIPAEASPGIEKVLANLELSPPDSADKPITDIQIAAAKQLARDLADAGLIEEPVRERIIARLTPPEASKEK
ncbi:MAG: hypothetical protein MUF86_09085 [Akkermansiaceae bacterium]|jgi:hypothetical protein|nr:hypothetical protein [Akkermansiaceae bacterium]MCU0777807.1 hypothetical protein [Akkermansiaceae bacterium]